MSPKLSDAFMKKSKHPTQGQGRGADSCGAFYPDGKMHRLPRRQAWTPAEHERKRRCLHAMDATIAQFR